MVLITYSRKSEPDAFTPGKPTVFPVGFYFGFCHHNNNIFYYGIKGYFRVFSGLFKNIISNSLSAFGCNTFLV